MEMRQWHVNAHNNEYLDSTNTAALHALLSGLADLAITTPITVSKTVGPYSSLRLISFAKKAGVNANQKTGTKKATTYLILYIFLRSGPNDPSQRFESAIKTANEPASALLWAVGGN